MRIAAVLAITFFVIVVFTRNVPAQTMSAETAANDEMLSDETMAAVEMGGRVSGKVMYVNPALDTLSVRDLRDGTGAINLVTNDETTYFGTESIKSIKPGDEISVDCISINGGYVAENIVMEKRYIEDKPLPVLEKVLSD